jgi:signal transduction histidine kinase
MFTSLRTRLILLFVGLIIVPLGIVGTLIAYNGSGALQQQSVTLLNQVTQRISISLEAFFNERKNELRILTEVNGLGSLDRGTQTTVLATLLKKQSAYYQLTLVNGDGQGLMDITRGQVILTDGLASFADDPLFKQAIQTNTISFSNASFDDNARDQIVTIAVPMLNLFTGEVAQVLIGKLRFQDVTETILRDLKLAPGDDVYIVDNTGAVVAHRNPSFVLKGTVFKLPATEGRYPGLNGSDVVLAMHSLQLGGLDLTVVAETSYANATALASELTRLAVIITIVSILVSSVIVGLVVSRAVSPVLQMARIAENIQAGDLSQRADTNRRDELGKLAQAFNSMTAQLRQSLEGLRNQVAELERARIEREKLIQDLQVAKRLAEENSRLKSEFLATMSHELRTPLNAIEGFTGIILNRMSETDFNSKTEKYLTRIRANSSRLLQLINDFLDLSRIEAGRLELANQPFIPAQLVKRWRDEIGLLAEKKGLVFAVRIDPTLPETLYGDEEAISKIGLNLLGNAIKFTDNGQIVLSLGCSDSTWNIVVEDTGIGIPPHAREFIFEEFRQVDQTSKRKYGGTGLGLAIVQKYARAMGGTVSLKSELGKGSAFTVSLPLKTTALPSR